ncbi:hypothetical protein [Pontibacter mangrovi]|uniref:hypothetical protein n=1 Tax=Pontibacter mangrovi TaxID=2589816 RepID=UPI0015E2EEAF|nr:hypothetical protein [Pontibacter mangrovi]
MVTLFFSLLITIISGTAPTTPENNASTVNNEQDSQTITTFGGASTWTDISE